MPQHYPSVVVASLLLLIGSAAAAAAAAAVAGQEVATLEQDVAAGAAAKPQTAAAAAEGNLPHSRIAAHFSLGEKSYDLPLSLGSSSGASSRQGGPKRGTAERAALSAAGGVLCLILFTIAKDLAATAKAKYKKRQQQQAIKALTTQRHAALAAMRQAAEFLLQLQPGVQHQQQQQQELLAAAALVEAKLLDLVDIMPETDRIGRLLIKRLMKAAGVHTPEQQQQQRVQHEGGDMEDIHAAASSRLIGDHGSSTALAHAFHEEPEYLEPREGPQQWLPELDEEAWGTGQSSEELYQAMVAEGSPIVGAPQATFERMELLNALLSENVDLSNKDALLIISGVQGVPFNLPEAQGAPSSDLNEADKLTEV
ncbi:hypothetical protein Emag_000290 [Eimeria magna]